jgi:hypothetical protein
MSTIVWDVDDVLNDLTRVWFERAWLPAHPACTLNYEELKENPPHRLLGVPLSDYLTSLDAFRLSEAGQDLTPVAEVLAWFRQFGGGFRHLALTGTPMVSAAHSAAWVVRHFGEWIRSFHFVPALRGEAVTVPIERSKADFLRWLGRADAVVDDNAATVEAARALGIWTLLMPRPWNRSGQSVTDALTLLTTAPWDTQEP